MQIDSRAIYSKSLNQPPVGLFILYIFGWGLFEGGLYEGVGAYKIIVDIKKTELKDTAYFSRNFFIKI